MKLYEMGAQYAEIEKLLEQAEDESAIEALTIALDDMDEDLDEKLLSIGKLIESHRTEAAAIKEVADRQAKRAKQAIARAEWLEQYAMRTMKATNHTKIVSPELTMRIKRGSGAVDVFDAAAVPSQFIKVVEVREVSKADLRQTLLGMEAQGVDPVLPGARLVFNEKLEVK